MKKRFGVLLIGVLLILIITVGFISALTPALCKDSDGYYNDCGVVHGYSQNYYSNVGYYSDYGNYDYGKLTYCRNSRGEYYYCYKQYNNYDYDNRDYYDNYDYHYYSDRDYSQQYNDNYGNVIRITRPGYSRQYCYWVDDGWRGSRKVCYDTNSYDYQNDPYYPDYYVQMNTNNQNMNGMIYIR